MELLAPKSELIFTGRDIENFKFRVVESKVVERLDYPFMADCICYYEGVRQEYKALFI